MVISPFSTARRIGRADRSLMARSAAVPPSAADTVIRRLSRSADKGVLWWAVAGLLATRKGPPRRAALRGVAAIAAASPLTNAVAKPLLPRRRPAAGEVPGHRRLSRSPTSSSFPSGHAASAAAFATAVSMECPRAGIAVVPLALTVAYSRVHTGVHWPSDVAAGMAIGVAAGLGTRHWWPLHPDVPGRTAHRADAPTMRDGEDMIALVNPSSGLESVDPTELVRQAWPKATIVHPDPDTDIRHQLATLIADRNGAVRALAVAGGDGTAAAVAGVAADHGLPLALVPAGTLNRFARDVGVQSVDDADESTENGSAVGIDLGEVVIDPDGTADDKQRSWFVNTAGLGGYPEMVRLREKLQGRWRKWPAFVIASIATLRHARPLPVELNGKPQRIWMLFVGNGRYAPKGFAPSRRPALDTGVLDVRYVRADVRWSRTRFLLAAITNTLTTSHVYHECDLPALEVRLLDGPRRIATDGEVGPPGRVFRFRSRPSALAIYRG